MLDLLQLIPLLFTNVPDQLFSSSNPKICGDGDWLYDSITHKCYSIFDSAEGLTRQKAAEACRFLGGDSQLTSLSGTKSQGEIRFLIEIFSQKNRKKSDAVKYWTGVHTDTHERLRFNGRITSLEEPEFIIEKSSRQKCVMVSSPWEIKLADCNELANGYICRKFPSFTGEKLQSVDEAVERLTNRPVNYVISLYQKPKDQQVDRKLIEVNVEKNLAASNDCNCLEWILQVRKTTGE